MNDRIASTANSEVQLTQVYSKTELKECQFQSWYTKFRKSKDFESSIEYNATPRSIILPLPETFVQYLLCDGVELPADATQVSSCVDAIFENLEEDSWDAQESENTESAQFSFPELTESISKAIAKLGGSVFPKLNWSSPKDASWMNGGSLKCKTAGDVYLLLKSSDFIMHDLMHAWDDVVDTEANELNDLSNRNSEGHDNYFLILRKWCNLHPSMEFRCFVASQQLVAISQREHTQCYPHLQSQRMQIRQLVIDFFEEIIRDNFEKINSYVFDCYIDKDQRVWIIDFNLWGARTDSLLFTWKSLEKMKADLLNESNDDEDIFDTTKHPEIRVVDSENEVHHDPLASYRAPIDTVDLAKDSLGAQSFTDFMAKCEKPSFRND